LSTISNQHGNQQSDQTDQQSAIVRAINNQTRPINNQQSSEQSTIRPDRSTINSQHGNQQSDQTDQQSAINMAINNQIRPIRDQESAREQRISEMCPLAFDFVHWFLTWLLLLFGI
jgi:hypothetical protein